MRVEALCALGCALWLGCASRPSGGVTVVPTPEQGSEASDWHEAQDLLSARMRSIADGLRATGFEPGGFAQRGFLASGARATHELRAPAGRCLTVVALATSGIADLDASIFEADGQAVSQDAASDARPVLRACARGEERQLYYVLHAFSGNGAYLVASFEGPLEGAGPRELTATDAGPASHTDWTAALVRRGFEPEGAPVELSLSPESQVRVALPARVGQCVALVAFAAEGEADVNLWLADETGVDRVRDEASRPWAGVQLCPDASGVFTARVSVRGEAARVLVGRFAGRASHVGGERAMWLGEVMAAEGSGFAQDAAKAMPPGTSGRLSAGAVERRGLPFPQGRCAQLQTELGEGLSSVRVRVSSASGARLREAVLHAGDPGLHVCGEGGRRVQVQVEARQGVGDYVLRARPVDDALAWLGEGVPSAAAARLLDLRAVAQGRGWPEPELLRLSEASLRCEGALGCEWREPLSVNRGKCISAALIEADGRRAALAIRAPGVAEARARRGFTTRCAHGGEVTLRGELPEKPGTSPFLLRVVHDAVH